MGQFVPFLREVDLFYNLTNPQIEMIDALCEERVYKKGEYIFEENSPENEMYLILDGEIEITVNPALVSTDPKMIAVITSIAVLRRGQCFGEMALLDEGVRSAGARVGSKTARVMRIPRQRFLLLCNTYPELGYRVMYNLAVELAQKIRMTDLHLRESILQKQPGSKKRE
jgi:CRP-like cAMP-binding protein